jgi:hypothetical protein
MVILAHISETNNHPEKALREAEGALRSRGVDGVKILVAEQDNPSPLVEL